MLRACGTWPLLGVSRNYCPAPPDRAYAREAAEGEGLRRQVHTAEVDLVETPPCPPKALPQPPQIHAEEPTPVPEPPAAKRADSKAIDEKVEQAGGKSGRLQFTLAWDTLDDLDLNVACPGGAINSSSDHRGPGICGSGVKDVDANRNLVENVSSTPVENVVWTGDYPDGVYKIEVIEYRASTGDGSTVPFTLRMRLGEQERECHGVVTTLPNSQIVERNGVTESGIAQTISWRSGEPLPSCDFIPEKTFSTNGSK